MLQIPETGSFLSPLPSVSNTAASFIWWVITQEEAITIRLHQEQYPYNGPHLPYF